MSWVTPPLVLLAVAVLDLVGGPDFDVLTLVIISPMLAAAVRSARATAAYAVAALAAGGLLGIPDHYYGTDVAGGAFAQAIRLAGIAVAGVIAVAAARKRCRREERMVSLARVAEVAQRAILSSLPAELTGTRLAVTYASAAAEASVGGDLYEAVDTPWGVRLLIGDVRGKGLDAVRLASRVLGSFRAVARYVSDPGTLLGVLDREVADVGGAEDFVTAVVAQIGPDGTMTLFNAGHPDPVLLRNGSARLVAAAGRQPPLGLGEDRAASIERLAVGDRLLFYTDGLAEARHAETRAFFPVMRAVDALSVPDLDDGLAAVISELREWSGSLNDDVALLAIEVTDAARTDAA